MVDGVKGSGEVEGYFIAGEVGFVVRVRVKSMCFKDGSNSSKFERFGELSQS